MLNRSASLVMSKSILKVLPSKDAQLVFPIYKKRQFTAVGLQYYKLCKCLYIKWLVNRSATGHYQNQRKSGLKTVLQQDISEPPAKSGLKTVLQQSISEPTKKWLENGYGTGHIRTS